MFHGKLFVLSYTIHNSMCFFIFLVGPGWLNELGSWII